MKQAVLAINAGSSSLKFAAFSVADGATALDPELRGEVDRIGNTGRFTVQSALDAPLIDESIQTSGHRDALSHLLGWLEESGADLNIIAAGHRVVHGGMSFHSPTVVDEAVLHKLRDLIPLAPLHQPYNLEAISTLQRLKPGMLQVACFDTAFHHTMPPTEQLFALPRTLSDEGVRRYGFHGLSYDYIASVLPGYLDDKADGRVIVAHLGHGASLCAMQGRKSVATTMSFTPLDGLPMATRSGAIDPAVVLYLLKTKGLDTDAVSDLLHHKSGLLGVSEVSGDMRDLLASDNPHAEQAIDLFVDRVNREIGALAAALGGLDALVFTGGIGENASEIRQRICRKAHWLGITANDAANADNEPQISDAASRVSVWRIPTNEELVIARQTLRTRDHFAIIPEHST